MNHTSSSNNTPVALITGGGTGLGLATGLELVRRGYAVHAAGLDTEPALDGSGITFHTVDVTDEAAVTTLAGRFSRLDALVNAAGIILHQGREHTVEGFRKVVDVNLNGSQLAITATRDALVAARGSVVNFASMWSYFGSPGNPAYSASKGAIVSLTRSYAVTLAAEGVRVNAVAPGWIQTRMAATAMNDPVRRDAITRRIPLGFWGEPHDVAMAAAFLLSADARYITGAVLPIDGGYSVA